MWSTYGLINSVLGLILLYGTTAAFRFTNEGRGRPMPRTSLVPPPPPPPPPPRGTRHITGASGGHRVTTYGTGQSSGRYWPQRVQQQVTSRQNRFKFPKQRQHPQPRALQYELPVRTLQQNMGYDEDLVPAASSNQIWNIAPRASSPQATTGTLSSSNNPPSFILTVEEGTALCQRCEMLNHWTSAACCSGYSQCCQQNIPHHNHNQLQNLTPPHLGQIQIYQQRNSHQQGHAQVPAQQHIYTDNVHIYNKYDSQFNSGNVEPAYDIRDPDYGGGSGFPDDDYETVDELEQPEFSSNRDRRSGLADLFGALAIAGISTGVRMLVGNSLGDGVPQRQHKAFGPIIYDR